MTKEQSMTSKSSDVSSQGSQQGDNVTASGQPGPPEHQTSRSRNQVFKSGPLFISSKGIGWTSWKKRWFILTRTSLVFFRSDPSLAPQRGGEVNLTLGGIDLNNSASVEVKADKKLLTVFFPDGPEGRSFTLKAETSEDLQEWKTALENAVALAPSPSTNPGQNGVTKSEQGDDLSGDNDEKKDGSSTGPPGKNMVLGRPILLALEDIDGTPSFLEKALQFIEDHGLNCEGVLRQAADVDEVYHRVHEFEQGKTEFSPDEDAHIIGDCIKYILRELPSAPVPASCCNALLEAFRTDRNNRVNAMRNAILETFPEPNRRLLQRILQMMQIVASNKTVNRMSTSAVAACMSPLLLRPLLAGECELGDTHMDVAGDGSFQLLQAAAAANHAQAIIITLLNEYDKIFGDGSMSDGGLFSDSDESGSGSEEGSDDDMYEDDDDEEYIEEDDQEDGSEEHEETDDEYEHSVAGSNSGSGDEHGESDSNDDKARKNLSTESVDFKLDDENEIGKLEATKRDLESRIEEEASGNTKLQASLEKRKKALHEHRLALEQDVTRLQEQLQKERDLHATLEAKSASKISQMPEKAKVELQKIELAEEKFNNLKQRLDDIDKELHHQHDQTIALFKDMDIEVPDTLSQGTKAMHNKEIEMKDESLHKGSSKKEGQRSSKMDGDHHDNDQKNQSSKKNHDKQSDVPRGGSFKFGWFSGHGHGHSSSTEASLPKPSRSTSRKSSIKEEEKRTHIANEPESIDKGRGSTTQPVPTPGKGKGPGPTHDSHKNQGPAGSSCEKEYCVFKPSSSGKGLSIEADKNKANNQSDNKKGSSSKSEASPPHNEQHLDRLKSEGGQSSSRNSEKGRQQDAKPTRTLSR